MIEPSDKFVDRWARLFLAQLYERGPKEAETWANRTLNKRDYPRIRERMLELRKDTPTS